MEKLFQIKFPDILKKSYESDMLWGNDSQPKGKQEGRQPGSQLEFFTATEA